MKKWMVTVGLTAAVLIAGCDGLFKKPNDGVSADQVEGQKAELLRQIERKYENPEAHYQLGKLYTEDGLYNKAEWEYNVTLQFDPVHYRAQAAMVKLLMDTQQTDKSKLAAEMYMNQAAASAQASSLLGKAFQKETLDEYALACYQQALALAPNSAALHKQIGYYYLAKGDTVRAEEYLRRSIQIDPYQPEVAEQLGRMGIPVQLPKKKTNPNIIDKLLNKDEPQ